MPEGLRCWHKPRVDDTAVVCARKKVYKTTGSKLHLSSGWRRRVGRGCRGLAGKRGGKGQFRRLVNTVSMWENRTRGNAPHDILQKSKRTCVDIRNGGGVHSIN